MAQYEQRLAADKRAIRQRVAAVAERVGKAVNESVRGLLAGDLSLSSEIMLGDLPINREIRAIDALCHAFVARHLPSAGHLRFVSSVMRMTVALERIGDYAVTIAREAVQLADRPPEGIAQQIDDLATQASGMFAQAMQAFVDKDAELARETKPMGRDIHRAYCHVFDDLTEDSFPRPLRDRFGLQSVFSRLERVCDQAKNLCEETLFELTGETKPPKVYRVLFVDHTGALLGPLATAIARKAFPGSGRFETAGYAPGRVLAPELTSLADQLGLDLSELSPRQLPDKPGFLDRHHVIVLLSQQCRKHLGVIPFHTVCVEWSLPPVGDGDGKPAAQALTDIAQQLSAEIRELLVTLRGEDAD